MTRPASPNSSSSAPPATSAQVSEPAEATSPGAASSRSAVESASSTGPGRSAAAVGALHDDRRDPVGEAERLQAPGELDAGEVAADDRGQHVPGQPALGVAGHPPAQQLQRDDRHRLVQRQAVEVRQRAAVLDRHQPRLGDPLRGGRTRCRGRRRRRPAAPGHGRPARRAGAGTRAPRAAAAALTSSVPRAIDRLGLDRAAEGALHERLAAGVEHEDGGADQGRQRPGQRLEPALGEHDPLEPLVGGDRPAQDRVLLVDQLREGGLGDGDERHLVGDLEHRELALGGRLRPAPAAPARGRTRPRSRARRAGGRPAGRRTRAAGSAVLSSIPVVSSSSPPDSHGVGSCSSEMCTQRTGRSTAASPVSRRTSRPLQQFTNGEHPSSRSRPSARGVASSLAAAGSRPLAASARRPR